MKMITKELTKIRYEAKKRAAMREKVELALQTRPVPVTIVPARNFNPVVQIENAETDDVTPLTSVQL